MAKRIYLSVLQQKAPDRIREIEMAVDKAVVNQAVGAQFWEDVRLYGLKEAVVYLRGYIQQQLAYPVEVEMVAKLCSQVLGECGESTERIVFNPPSQPRPLPIVQETEGNGWDSVETSHND